MNRLLRERVAQAWKQRHEEIQCLQKRLAELNTQAAARALTVDEQWQRVVALANVETTQRTRRRHHLSPLIF